MSHKKGTPLAIPRSVEEIQDLEDRFSEVSAIFRGIRKGMGEQAPARPRLKLGTVDHYLKLCEDQAARVQKDYALEVQDAEQDAIRERKRARLAENAKKNK